MRLIIEGPDGSGKTTLVNRFMERYPDLVLMPRACTSEDGPIDELAHWVDTDLTSQLHEHCLYDRHPLISELIYSPALGRPLAKGFNNRQWLSNAFRGFYSSNFSIVYCLPDRDTVISNVQNTHGGTGHQSAVVRNIGAIYDLYHVGFCASVFSTDHYTLRWDYSSMDWQDFGDRWFGSYFVREKL